MNAPSSAAVSSAVNSSGSPVHEVLVRIPAVALLAQRDEVPEVGSFPAHLLDLFDAFGAGDDGHRARVLGPELRGRWP